MTSAFPLPRLPGGDPAAAAGLLEPAPGSGGDHSAKPFHKLSRGRWDPGLPHSRQCHWLKGLLRQVSLYLGSSWSDDLLGAFDWLRG
ncbi:hypothetical protein DFAR_3980007 [Desulfarculales bacterium]